MGASKKWKLLFQEGISDPNSSKWKLTCQKTTYFKKNAFNSLDTITWQDLEAPKQYLKTWSWHCHALIRPFYPICRCYGYSLQIFFCQGKNYFVCIMPSFDKMCQSQSWKVPTLAIKLIFVCCLKKKLTGISPISA